MPDSTREAIEGMGVSVSGTGVVHYVIPIPFTPFTPVPVRTCNTTVGHIHQLQPESEMQSAAIGEMQSAVTDLL